MYFIFQKSLQLSQDLKNSGNILFKTGKYLDAIKCYTEAIEICPPEEKDVLSTYYQNRAAAHEQLVSCFFVILLQQNFPSIHKSSEIICQKVYKHVKTQVKQNYMSF